MYFSFEQRNVKCDDPLNLINTVCLILFLVYPTLFIFPALCLENLVNTVSFILLNFAEPKEICVSSTSIWRLLHVAMINTTEFKGRHMYLFKIKHGMENMKKICFPLSQNLSTIYLLKINSEKLSTNRKKIAR